MEVVLNKNIEKLGYKGDVVRVKRGYFRNFLFPQGLADFASENRVKLANSRKEKTVMEKKQVLDNAEGVLKKLKGLKLTLSGKTSGKDKLYGSITEDDVIAAIEAESKVKLERSFLKMEHLKKVGEHKVVVHLGEGLEETITVVVKGLEE